MAEETRNLRKVRQGVVVSDANDKTIVVQIKERKAHPIYKKMMTSTKKFHAHDENNECGIGDTVEISMAKKAGMLAYQELCALKYSNDRADYSDDVTFANFRAVTIGNIGAGKLYRSASPINNAHGRASYANTLIAEAGVATVLNLADSEEYKDLLTTGNLDLCDTVTVRFAKLGVDVQSKVVDIVWDVLNDRYSKIEIGERRSTLAATIEDQMQTITTLATSEDVTRTVDRATGVLNAGRRGHVIINRNAEGYANEILFLDNENIAAARNVLRINMNGIGFSSNGYFGGNFYQAWTLDGVLSLGGVNNAYGDMQILDPSGNKICTVNKDGYTLYDTNGSTMIGQWNHNGINVKKGSISGVSIDIARGNNIGLYCNGTHFQFGDFEVNDEYGRQILESSDEMTGMSGEPDSSDGLYLWAGYTDADDYAFAVNEAGAYCKYGSSTHYNIGEEIYKLWQAVGGGGGGCSSDGGGGCGCDGDSYVPCGCDGGDCENICSEVGT